MQLWDLLRSVDYLVKEEKLPLAEITVYGRGHMGALALYAATLDSRIARVILDDPPASHWQGPPLLNILRITDLPEVAAMVAPREIVSLSDVPAGYAYTDAVYRLFGQSGSMRRANDLGEALEIRKHY